MYNFDLNTFLHDKMLSIGDLSKMLKRPYKSIAIMAGRKTVKPEFIRTLEAHYGDCSKYIIKDSSKTRVKVA